MIKLQVIGHLGKDCVVNNVNGKSVINFSVAHSEKYKDAQGVAMNKTTWVEVAYWSDRVAVAPYLKQGTMVFVEGQPEVRQYTTKTGQQGASLSLRAVSVQLLGGSKDSAQQGAGHFQQTGNPQGSYPQASPNNYPPPSAYQNQGAATTYNDIPPTADDSDLPF